MSLSAAAAAAASIVASSSSIDNQLSNDVAAFVRATMVDARATVAAATVTPSAKRLKLSQEGEEILQNVQGCNNCPCSSRDGVAFEGNNVQIVGMNKVGTLNVNASNVTITQVTKIDKLTVQLPQDDESTEGPLDPQDESTKGPLNDDQAIKQFLKNEADYDVDDDSADRVSKRTDYLSWDDYFMSAAVLSSLRSKDPHHACGCCIVDDRNRIIGIGYNGFPMQCSDDVLPWVPPANGVPFLHTYEPYVVHAIINAILCSGDVRGARLYVSEYPCAECAKTIIQAGISEVVFMDNHGSDNVDATSSPTETLAASRIMFQMAGVTVRLFVPSQDKVKLVRGASTLEIPADPPEMNGIAKKTNDDNEALRLVKQTDLVRKEANLEVTSSTKRPDYLTWDDYFMWMAFLTAQRSKDPNTQVGACLVLEKRIVGLGYNGFPLKCSDDLLPWARQAKSPLHTKYPYVCHAEVNAIMNRIFPNVRGATLYVALFPCNECAKFIIQAGIRKVVYLDDKYHDTDICRASRILFGMAGVKLRQHTPARESLVLHLNRSTAKDDDKSCTKFKDSNKDSK